MMKKQIFYLKKHKLFKSWFLKQEKIQTIKILATLLKLLNKSSIHLKKKMKIKMKSQNKKHKIVS